MPADVPTTGPNLRTENERPPVEPLAALQHTQAGANAFAKFFIETIDWAYATTSTTYMRHYFEHSCVTCRSISNAVDKDRRKRYEFVGDRFSVRGVHDANGRARAVGAIVTFDVTSTEVVDRHSHFVDGYPALKKYREHVFMAWRAAKWIVADMVPLGELS